MYIKLTSYYDYSRNLYLYCDKKYQIEQSYGVTTVRGSFSCVFLVTTFHIKETPEEINKIIENAKFLKDFNEKIT